MNTKQPEALRLAHIFEHPLPPEWSDMVAATKELRRQHAEIETLRTGYSAARLEIASLHTQMEAVATPAQPLHVAATSCPHEIDKDKIVLHFDSKQPGKNALAQLAARLQAAQAAPVDAAVQQDAERYHWLRDNRSWQVLHRIRPGKSIEYRMRDDGDWWGSWWPTHEQAIDAARAAQKGTND